MNKFNLIAGLSAGLMATTTIVVPVGVAVAEKHRAEFGATIYKNAITEIQGICKIPHPSNEVPPVKFDETDDNLFAIRQYLIDRIDKYMGDNTAQIDDARNIYFDIPASKGCENYKGIALQAHMDMVWSAQGEASSWNPKTHPVSEPVMEEVDGNYVMHTKDWLTSLGADDAQGMGMILSIAKNHKKFKHGLIKCVITADEETTGHGAANLGIVDGKRMPIFENIQYLVTLDLPHGGKIATTAAGIEANSLNITGLTTEDSSNTQYEISFSDFLGGHSGEEIDLGRSSPLKLAGRLMNEIIADGNKIQLANISTSCTKMNKIPEDATVIFTSESSIAESIRKHIDKIKTELKIRGVESKAKIDYETKTGTIKVLSTNDSQAVINLVDEAPFGPYERFDDDWFVGSSANLSPFAWTLGEDNKVSINAAYSARFGHLQWQEPLKQAMNDSVDKFKIAVPTATVTLEQTTTYPVWEYIQDNKIRDLFLDSYKKVGVDAQPMKSHGGLETAHIVKNYPDIIAIAAGATDLNEHMVNEQLLLNEYKDIAKAMLLVLQNMNI